MRSPIRLVTQAAQHAFAHPALAGVDDELERAIHQDQRQEGEAEGQQQVLLFQLEATEQWDGFAREELAERQVELEEGYGRARPVKSLALYALVDDRLGKVER
jgi:hypothetical protein